MGGERVEAPLPSDSTREHPVLDCPEPACVEATHADPALLLPRHEARPGEDLEVLVHGRERHRQGRRKIGHARRRPRQPVEDRPPCRVRQSPECGVKQGRVTVKHLLKYIELADTSSQARSGKKGELVGVRVPDHR